MCEKLVSVHENSINYIAWIWEDLFLSFRDDISVSYPIDSPLQSKLLWSKRVYVGSGITSHCISVNPQYLSMGKYKVTEGICNHKYIFNTIMVVVGQLAPRVYGTVLHLYRVAQVEYKHPIKCLSVFMFPM